MRGIEKGCAIKEHQVLVYISAADIKPTGSFSNGSHPALQGKRFDDIGFPKYHGRVPELGDIDDDHAHLGFRYVCILPSGFHDDLRQFGGRSFLEIKMNMVFIEEVDRSG